MELRPYQQEVLDSLWDWFGRHDDGNPIIEAAVGAGKSLMIAAVCQRIEAQAPGTRILVLVHQKELLEQNVEKLRAVWPNAPVGLYSAAVGKKQMGRQITYATIGSIYKKAFELGEIGVILVDECHLVSPKDTGMWRQFLTDLAKTNPHARVFGWTGTPFRGNGVWLTAGDEALFTHIAAQVKMRALLEQGYLAPLVPATTVRRVRGDGVRTSGDDYVVSDLARVTDTDELVQGTCDEIVELGRDRKRWLVFAVTVEHAEHVRDALKARGVAAEAVSAETPKAERNSLIARFRAGQIRCLVNVAVLTTGFDVPSIDFIALLRLTKSPVLYVQIAGRGMRLSPETGKVDCLWADFTETTETLGPVDEITGRNPRAAGKGEAPFKLCEKCGSRNATGASKCVDCGHEFPPPERIKHAVTATGAAILSGQPEGTRWKEHPVTDVDYLVHEKPGRPDSMRVVYRNGWVKVGQEFVLLDHHGTARSRAESWWQQRSKVAIPRSVGDAVMVAGEVLRKPASILVNMRSEYKEIAAYTWADGAPELVEAVL